jgi:DNA-binding transcriptional ArsR family regulator
MGDTQDPTDSAHHELAKDSNNPGKGEKPKEWHSTPFDDEGITISGAFAQQMGYARALILDHIFFTFVHHYDSPHVFRGPHPDRPDEPSRTWIYFSLANFVRHIGLAESNIRAHLKALREEGWIDSFHQPGKVTYFRPNLERFFNSSHYRAKVKRCDREPDFPGNATPPPAPMPPPPRTPPESGGPLDPTPLEAGGVPPSNQAGYPHRTRRGSHILENDLKEPSKKNPACAPANARGMEGGKKEDIYRPRYPDLPSRPQETNLGSPFDEDEGASDEQSRERHKNVLLAALLEGLSAGLIRRKAAEWGFELDDLIREAAELRATGPKEPCKDGRVIEGKGGAIKPALQPQNRVA